MNKQGVKKTPKGEDKSVETFGLPGLMSELSERIRFAVTAAGGDAAVSARSGVKVRSLQNYKSGGATPSATALGHIAKATGFSLDWLLFAEGPMKPRGPERGLSEEKVRFAVEGPEPDGSWVALPIYSARAAAGHGAYNEPGLPSPGVAFDPQLAAYFLRSPRNALAGLYVSGDSMEPTFSDGDVLIVDLSVDTVKGDAIYVLVVDDACVVKRIAPRVDGSLRLLSDNPAYGAEEVPRDRKADLRVYGRVVAAMRRF